MPNPHAPLAGERAPAPFDVFQFEYTIQDALADLAALNLILEAAIPDDDASDMLGLPRNPGLFRVVMPNDVHRALLRSVLHVGTSVRAIHAQFNAGGCAAMMRGAGAEGRAARG